MSASNKLPLIRGPTKILFPHPYAEPLSFPLGFNLAS
jgi:hypothetical protein